MTDNSDVAVRNLEVRFRDRDAVFRGVGQAVRRALLAHTPVPEVDQLSSQLRWSPTWGRKQPSRETDPAWDWRRSSLDRGPDAAEPVDEQDGAEEGHRQ